MSHQSEITISPGILYAILRTATRVRICGHAVRMAIHLVSSDRGQAQDVGAQSPLISGYTLQSHVLSASLDVQT